VDLDLQVLTHFVEPHQRRVEVISS